MTADFRLMTDDERALAKALRRGAFMVSTLDRQFAQKMGRLADQVAPPEITEKQAAHLRKLIRRYRKKVRRADVPESEHYLLEEPTPGGKR